AWLESAAPLAILEVRAREALAEGLALRLPPPIEFLLPDEPERRRLWEQLVPTEDLTAPLPMEPFAALELGGEPIRRVVLRAAVARVGERARAGHHRVEHRLGEPAGEGVLLAGVVAAEEGVRADPRLGEVAEAGLAAAAPPAWRWRQAPLAQHPQRRLPGEAAQ